MKLISWNVNGLRAVLKKNFLEFLDTEKPDILCLQETKCSPDDVEQLWPAKYTTYWNSAVKKGYSGTAIFTKQRPLKVTPHLGITEHDQEGRVLTAEYDDFFLVNVYVPNSKRELTRLPYRQQWDADFLKFLKKLEKKKPVVLCGDLNVAHTEIDLANPKANVKNHGFTPEERAGFSAFVNAGFLDINTGEIKVAGVGGVGLNGDVENSLNWAPRLGIAYQATDRTVIRAGYGRSYDIGVFGSVFGHSVTQNLPVLAAQQLTAPGDQARVFTLAEGPPAPIFPTPDANGRFPLPNGVFTRS